MQIILEAKSVDDKLKMRERQGQGGDTSHLPSPYCHNTHINSGDQTQKLSCQDITT